MARAQCEVCGVELSGRVQRWCRRHANAAHGFGVHHSASEAARVAWDRREAEREELARLRIRQQQEGQRDG